MGEADALLRIGVTDDVGARTAGLFHGQAAMAGADGTAAFLDELTDDLDLPFESTSAVVCEQHEDWVMRIGDQLEIVSAKRREPNVGPWGSITVLVSDGGLGHLFTRWLRLVVQDGESSVWKTDAISALAVPWRRLFARTTAFPGVA